MFTFNPKKTTPLRYAYTWTIPFLLWAICPTLLSGQTAISLGDDDLVGEGETVELSATINIPGEPPPGSGLISSSEAFTLLWYKRTIDEADYPAEPFATSGVEIGETTATLSDSPIEESTYYKVVLSDQTGVACEDEVLKVAIRLSKLLFHDSHTIYYDPGVPPINTGPSDVPTPYVDPGILPNAFHWLRPTNPSLAVVSKPVCYTRNTAFKVSALVKMDGVDVSTIDLAAIKLKATASATGFDATISPNADVLTPVSGGYLFAMTTASAAFPDVIGVYDLQMAWEYSENGGTDWQGLATTQNSVYATLNPPIFTPNVTYLFYSTLDISCRNAQGLNGNNLSDVANAIYDEFLDKSVVKASTGEELVFWEENSLYGEDPIDRTLELLYYLDGPCNAWAKFFMDMLKTHGIANGESTNQYEYISVSVTGNDLLTTEDNALFVQAIEDAYGDTYTLGGTPPTSAVFYLKNQEIDLNSFHSVVAAATGGSFPGVLEGIEGEVVNGQGFGSNAYPPMFNFTNHALVEFAGKYYDPSYGTLFDNGTPSNFADDTPFPDIKSWENASIVGTGSFFCPITTTECFYANSDVSRIFWMGFQNSANTQDLQEGVSSY